MAEEKKRLTPAELRKQQEDRERLARETQAKADEKARQEYEARVQAELRAAGERVKATWYNAVLAASQRPGIRFLVLAQVIDRGGPVVDDICAAIRADGYTCEFTSLQTAAPQNVPRARGGRPVLATEDNECEVSDGRNRGWKPAHLPSFGSNGVLQWLIVRW